MIFDSKAYAEGICNSAPGSSIETLTDTIEATIVALDRAADSYIGQVSGLERYANEEQEYKDKAVSIVALKDKWFSLAAQIKANEERMHDD